MVKIMMSWKLKDPSLNTIKVKTDSFVKLTSGLKENFSEDLHLKNVIVRLNLIHLCESCLVLMSCKTFLSFLKYFINFFKETLPDGDNCSTMTQRTSLKELPPT